MILERQIQTPLQITWQKSSNFFSVNLQANSLHKILNLHLGVSSVEEITPSDIQNTVSGRHSYSPHKGSVPGLNHAATDAPQLQP